MKCDNKACDFYSVDNEGNCEVRGRIGFATIFDYCKHYKEPISDLRVKCNRANRHVIDGSQEVFNNAIVEEIEALKK